MIARRRRTAGCGGRTRRMSGYGGPDLQAQAHAAGAQAVLMKPLAAAELAACLASVLPEVRGRTTPGCPAIPGTRPDFSAPG